MNKYKNYFENAGIAFLIIDEKGTIEHVNCQFESLAETTRKYIINKLTIFDFIAHEERDKIRNMLKNKFKEVTLPFSLPCKFISTKKSNKSVLLNLNYLPDEERTICSFVNVAPVRRAEKYAQQEHFQKELAKVASGLAHEIRNPLSAINTSIEILRDSLLVSGEDEELMNIILEENKRLDQIIKEFSYFARISDPDISLTHINELIEEAINYQQQNAPVTVTILTKLLDSPPPLYVDPSQIKTVLFHIMDNAIEAMSTGGVLEISTSLVKNEFDDDVLLMTFSDSGEGISEQDLDNIFKPFFSNKENHSGMGLPISKRIIEKHKGKIEIESSPEKGTKVMIHLPIIYKEILNERVSGLL